MNAPLQKATADLVLRARAGDQNAMGMIDSVRRSAASGSPRAKTAFGLLKAYIEANPVTKATPRLGPAPVAHATMGAEAREAVAELRDRGPVVGILALLALPFLGGPDAFSAGVATLANGPPLTANRIGTIGQGLDEHGRRYFYTGVHYHGHDGCILARMCPTTEEKGLLHAGRCVGIAKAIQDVRKPGSRISNYAPLAGWEHGE